MSRRNLRKKLQIWADELNGSSETGSYHRKFCRYKNKLLATANPFLICEFYDLLEDVHHLYDLTNKTDLISNLDEIALFTDPPRINIVEENTKWVSGKIEAVGENVGSFRFAFEQMEKQTHIWRYSLVNDCNKQGKEKMWDLKLHMKKENTVGWEPKYLIQDLIISMIRFLFLNHFYYSVFYLQIL